MGCADRNEMEFRAMREADMHERGGCDAMDAAGGE